MINYDLETFRAQTAQVENQVRELQEKNVNLDMKVQSLEHDKIDLQDELKNRELDLTKAKIQVEKLRNEVDTLKMFELKMDELSGECNDINMRLTQARAQNEKDTLSIKDYKLKLHNADLECKELRAKVDDLNRALDIHDEHKLYDLKQVKEQYEESRHRWSLEREELLKMIEKLKNK